MFYIEKENKIIFADDNRQRLVNTLLFRPDLTEADIQSTDKEIENFMFVDSPEWVEWKSAQVRELRNLYLETDVDPIASNPLRWADMTAAEQQQIKDYRQYLLTIPEQPEFPKTEVMKFEAWKQAQIKESEAENEHISA